MNCFTSRLNSVQNMLEKLLSAVREGRIDFSKADLIRKAPDSEQDRLLAEVQEQGLTKVDLAEKVKALKSTDNVSDQGDDMRTRIHQTYTRIRSRAAWQKIEGNSKLRKKLERIEALLKELNETLDE